MLFQEHVLGGTYGLAGTYSLLCWSYTMVERAFHNINLELESNHYYPMCALVQQGVE